ncbi:hypothetical protein DICSQDRAFT_138125 [Dichomitus squalens LYAD-421 SS1]|uniref:Uncharacterized protein n=1 Tax=Dichomitus squalens (strain LYAD-421) TaxID=732165 RepID=R7SUL2_DICSQ|nr:uncharacterized protein DICSQDRAFT_138125 [Dichomitus squalens LYAD-421 SS1]EJF59914.1 hypothetical protein DICSQDRAFT_138125 [Dichomitus squalens LYAD-421 SS1]
MRMIVPNQSRAAAHVGNENIDPQLLKEGEQIQQPRPVSAVQPYVHYPRPHPAGPVLQPLPDCFPSLPELPSPPSDPDVYQQPVKSPPTPPPSQPARTRAPEPSAVEPTPPTPPPSRSATVANVPKRNRSDTVGSDLLKATKKTRSEPGTAATEAASASLETLGVHWSVADRDLLYKFFLGSSNDDNYKLLKVNRKALFAKASKELYSGRHSESAIRSQWDRSLKTYQFINAFENFTGGGGDGDLSPVTSWDINAARSAGEPVGGLTAKMYQEWESNSWVELFNARLATSPKVCRKKKHHSNMPLSDDSPYRNGDDAADEPANASHSVLELSGSGPATDRVTVTDTRHVPSPTASQKSRSETSQSMAGISAYLKDKVKSDREVQAQLLEVRKARLDLERRAADRADEEFRVRQQQMEKQANAALAKDVLQAQGASPELRRAAESYLMNLFQKPHA